MVFTYDLLNGTNIKTEILSSKVGPIRPGNDPPNHEGPDPVYERNWAEKSKPMYFGDWR